MRKLNLLIIHLIILTSNAYTQTVAIGKQVWSTKNLDVSTFRNGDPIPEAKTSEEWNKATKKCRPVWCYNQNNPIYGSKYGKLYNWYAVNDPRGIAPEGFHVPSSIEWNEMIEFLGGAEKCALEIRESKGWKQSAGMIAMLGSRALNHDYNGNNKSGFSALPAGYRSHGSTFHEPGDNIAYWWTSTDDTKDKAWYVTFKFMIRNYENNYSEDFEELIIDREDGKKDMGYSIRCLKD